MKLLIRRLWSNDLIRGSSIFFVGNMVANFLAFLTQIFLVRLMAPEEYGAMVSLLGLTALVSLPNGALDTMVTKVVASHPLSSSVFLKRIFNFLFRILIVGSPLWFIALGPVSNFLHLENKIALFLIWFLVGSGFFNVVIRAALKGQLRFLSQSLNNIVEMAIRLVLSLVLVELIHPSFLGSLSGFLLASLLILVFGYFQLSPSLTDNSHQPFPSLNLKSLGLTSLGVSAAFAAMNSIDILLVKHFLTAYDAGIYGSLVTFGKIVFFAALPLGTALLPLASKKTHLAHTARRDLLITLALVSTISLSIILGYLLFPRLIIGAVSSKFIAAVPLLPWMGLAIFFYVLSTILANFLIALDRFWIVYVCIIAVVIETVLIVLFHTNLSQIVSVLNIIFAILAAVTLIASLYATKETKS